MFFGRFDYTLDPKGRINFPARFREEIGEKFVIMEWVDSCLFAIPMSKIDELAEKLGGKDWMNSWEASGDLFSTACEAEPDKQGRILLPQDLRDHAHLTKDVTIIGNRDHVELWDTQTWQARRDSITNEERKRRYAAMGL